MDSVKRLLIRADADSKIGTGHVMRCLVLAQTWKEQGGEVLFLTNCQIPSLVERIKEIAHYQFVFPKKSDIGQILATLKQWQAAFCILDGYHFDSHYQYQLYQSEVKVLLLDDMAHCSHYYADIILNQNINADKYVYEGSAEQKILLGLEYALIRTEFKRFNKYKNNVVEKARKLLITLGGSDPDNITLNILQGLIFLDQGWEVKIVVGAANKHLLSLENCVQSYPQFEVLTDVKNMAEVMNWADMAISASGSTVWELLALGVPSLLVVLAENQRHIAEELAQQNSVVYMDMDRLKLKFDIKSAVLALADNTEKRMQMAVGGQKMVNLKGADRVITCLKQSQYSLRKVNYQDAAILWQWANDKIVRQASFHRAAIAWEEHKKWLQDKIQSKKAILFLACNEENRPFAQVRFEINGQAAIISISISAQYRGKGHSGWLIEQAVKEIMKLSSILDVYAYIKPENKASKQSFSRAGFYFNKALTIEDAAAERWQLDIK